MIKLLRTTEYGLVALKHMSRKGEVELTSAREVAEAYGFPFEITAKTLLRLKDTGLIESAQGARGGYRLSAALLEATSLGEFLEMMEGPQGVVGCTEGRNSLDEGERPAPFCEYHSRCEIKHVMGTLQDRVWGFLKGIRLSELTHFENKTVAPDLGGASPVSIALGFSGGEP